MILPEEDADNLDRIIVRHGEMPEGSCMHVHRTFTRRDEFHNKQKNLFTVAKGAEKICEIGFNAGHSALLLLSGASTTIKAFVSFDIMEHDYGKECYEYVKGKYPGVSFEMVEGDSRFRISDWIVKNQNQIETFDVVHVDGGHNDSCFFTDFAMASLLCKRGGKIIIDDTNDPMIGDYVNIVVKSNNFKEVNILETYIYQHRIVEKLY